MISSRGVVACQLCGWRILICKNQTHIMAMFDLEQLKRTAATLVLAALAAKIWMSVTGGSEAVYFCTGALLVVLGGLALGPRTRSAILTHIVACVILSAIWLAILT
ncbi:hypothetical protein [Brevundimonas halotolerans]|jgi:DNA-directed RNA polymerase subunit RPC12/RpoP|uniref:DNA-directed RNA polymerase subunit RPC12/RpoP n=1 Tax=Brevundimonas halotolerans TaxID=69670 RepID=A0A7W9A2J3_9CAUL|nr:hypothetical protein [Brevundimonas halotolerans]MBB5660043.1 DNA-directed RNA polymerase subunit RPC12/RpoP [Brevundimonas halotolerans]